MPNSFNRGTQPGSTGAHPVPREGTGHQAAPTGSGLTRLVVQRWFHFVIIAAVMTGFSLLIYGFHYAPLRRIDNLAYDWYFKMRASPTQRQIAEELPNTRDIVLIETSHQLPRRLFARLLDQLSEAKVVAIDLMFVDEEAQLRASERPFYHSELKEWRSELGVLAAAVRRNGNVIVGTWPEQWHSEARDETAIIENANSESHLRWTRLPDRVAWEKPPPALWNSARYHAHLLVDPDIEDGVVRQVALFENVGTPLRPRTIPCLGLAIAAAVRGVSPQQLATLSPVDGILHLGSHRVRVGRSNQMNIDYLGGPTSFQSMSNHNFYTSILDSASAASFYTKDDFKDKIVIIGEVSMKSKEFFGTPFNTRQDMPGMQVHAHIAATLLSDAGAPVEISLLAAALISLAFCLILVAPLGRWPLWLSYFLAAILMISVVVLGSVIFAKWHGVLPASMPILALFMTINSVALYEYRRVRQTLGRFIGSEMVRQTLHTVVQLRLGGHSEHATAFFCDMRGYSGLTERMTTGDLSLLMNQYTDLLVQVVRRYGGRPIDYQGDGVFVLFEKQFAGDAYPLQAVRAALSMQEEFKQVRDAWSEEGEAPIEIGIGIDSGEMMIGAVGSTEHMKMGAIGDAVNVAARVQRLTRQCGYNVLLTRRTNDLVCHEMVSRPCGVYHIRGRSAGVELFGVGTALPAAPLRPGLEADRQQPGEDDVIQWQPP